MADYCVLDDLYQKNSFGGGLMKKVVEILRCAQNDTRDVAVPATAKQKTTPRKRAKIPHLLPILRQRLRRAGGVAALSETYFNRRLTPLGSVNNNVTPSAALRVKSGG
jgi:hypothetical protein